MPKVRIRSALLFTLLVWAIWFLAVRYVVGLHESGLAAGSFFLLLTITVSLWLVVLLSRLFPLPEQNARRQ